MHLTNHRITVVGIDLLELLKYPTVERRASRCVVSSLREERAIEGEFKFLTIRNRPDNWGCEATNFERTHFFRLGAMWK